MRDAIKESITSRQDGLIALSDAIWEYAETAFEEAKSAERLASYLQGEGFTVSRGVAGIATAFTASFGSGKPHIGILGEYDALSDLGQSAWSTVQDPPSGKPGHGCGHNILGAGAAAAAVAVRDYLIQSGKTGTVIYYGCPGEEGGSGKAFMARDGVFDGLDACITWHPGAKTNVSMSSSLANYQVLYRFRGVAAHASGQPHLGRSALDAVELMNVGVQFLREHIPTTARVHYAITNAGGYSPNVVQPEASVLYLIRMPEVTQLPELFERVNNIARGAALMTGTTVEFDFIKGCSNTIPNTPLAKRMQYHLESYPMPEYTPEELRFAGEIRKTLANPAPGLEIDPEVMPLPLTEGIGVGSTDVGDVSWVTPLVYTYVTTAPQGLFAHTWQMTSSAKTSIAHKGLIRAGFVMAETAIDIIEDAQLLQDARADFVKRLGGDTYICPIPKGVKPRPMTDIQ